MPTEVDRRRLIGWILLGLGILVIGVLGWMGVRAWQAASALQDLRTVAKEVQAEFDEHGISRPDRLMELAGTLAEESADARSAVSDPVYRMGQVLPWLGDNLTAVREVVLAVDGPAQLGPELAALTPELDDAHVMPSGGAFDLDLVNRASGLLTRLDEQVQAATTRIAGIDRSHLVGPVRDAVLELDSRLPPVAKMSATGATMAALISPMFGGNGPRTYLVAFQNTAEPRATGGIFGQWIELRFDEGRMTVVDQGSSSRDLGVVDDPIASVPEDTRWLYSDLVATNPVDVNFTPDFPTAARTFADLYSEKTGRSIDGVVAIDPQVVAQMLHGREPIVLADGAELTAQSVTPFLLSDVYRLFPTGPDAAARDNYLSAATLAVFAEVTGKVGDLRTTVSGVKDMADQRRVLVWSAHENEEELLLGTPLAGRLPDQDAADRPTLGFFVNDGTGAKLGYYLTAAVTASDAGCSADGRELAVAANLSYDPPTEGLPTYVLGPGLPDRPYVLRSNLMLYAPTGASLTSVQVDGKAVPVRFGYERGRAVAMVTVDLEPGQRARLTADVLLDPAGGAGDAILEPQWVVTPLTEQMSTSTEPSAPC